MTLSEKPLDLPNLRSPNEVHEIIRQGEYIYNHQDYTINSGYITIKKNKGHCLEWAFAAGLLMERLPISYSLEIIAMVFERIPGSKLHSEECLENGVHFIYTYSTKQGHYAIGKSRSDDLGERIDPFESKSELLDSYRFGFEKVGMRIKYSFNLYEDSLLDYDWRKSYQDLKLLGLDKHLKHLNIKAYLDYCRENKESKTLKTRKK